MKYKRRTQTTIDIDFQYYLGVVNLYHYFYGHTLSNKDNQKVRYIWNQLIKQYS